MARFIPPIVQLGNDSFSGPGSGWKLNFYDTGTLVRKDTFSDSALTVANANPVIADSAGRFGNIFLEAGTYRIILTDENDQQKWDADPVDGAVGLSGAVIVKTANYTVTLSDLTKIVAVDATAGAVTITLLAAATAGNGGEVTIKKTDASANAVTVDGSGAETIDGVATQVLGLQQSSITLRCDGTNWLVAPRTQEIIGAFALQGDISPAQITANQNDFNPTGLAGAAILRLNSDASRTITGLAGGADGRVVVIHNVGSNAIVLSDEDSGSTAANRFALAATITLGANVAATLNYDATSSRWRSTQSFLLADVQVFDVSGTWTKPTGGTIAIVDLWGGGGSGGNRISGGGGAGGGGGGYMRAVFLLAALGTTETTTVGAGGAAAGASSGSDGASGTNSTFGAFATAFGGGAGGGGAAVTGGGGGASTVSAGADFSGQTGGNAGTFGGAGGAPGNPGADNYHGGGGAGARDNGGDGADGGGGGAGGTDVAVGHVGGNSIFAGGGGGGASTTTNGAGGTSSNGGDGGAGAVNGETPSGGGGGSAGANASGAGGGGRIIVTAV